MGRHGAAWAHPGSREGDWGGLGGVEGQKVVLDGTALEQKHGWAVWAARRLNEPGVP